MTSPSLLRLMEHARRDHQGAADIGLLSEIDADIFAPANAFNRVRTTGAAASSAPASSSSSSSAPRPYTPSMPWGSSLPIPQRGQAPSTLGGVPNPTSRSFLPMEEASGSGAYRETFTDESSLDALSGAPNRGAGGATAHVSSSTSEGAGGGDTTTDAKKRNREHARQTRIRKKAYVAQVIVCIRKKRGTSKHCISFLHIFRLLCKAFSVIASHLLTITQLERTLRELRRQAAAAVSSEEAQYAVVINDMREKGREFLR